MLRLGDITEENWLRAASLTVRDDQKGFVAPSLGILARGYVYRDCGGRVLTVLNEGELIGLALVREFTDDPPGYDLQQFMIDERSQGKGFGSRALALVLDLLRAEGKYPCVEVCVKAADAAALHVYEKAGFVPSGYVDPDCPDCVNLIFRF